MHVHHQPRTMAGMWNLHAWRLAWDGNQVWDPRGVLAQSTVDFEFPAVKAPRTLQFKYRVTSATSATSGATSWEADDFVRQLTQVTAPDIWTFDESPRIIYRDPQASPTRYCAGDVLTIKALTRQRFAGGNLYIWNPYAAASTPYLVGETSRDEGAVISTFSVILRDWMVEGFHFKLMRADSSGNDAWEMDSANRVWRPCDGPAVWIKSGQCDVRAAALKLSVAPVEMMLAKAMQAPPLMLKDSAEQWSQSVAPVEIRPHPNSALFQIAVYHPEIYAGAGYTLAASHGENPPLTRPFPANPGDGAETSRFALGTNSWLAALPPIRASVQLVIQPQAVSSFAGGVSVGVALGNSDSYQNLVAQRGSDGNWTAMLDVAHLLTTRVQLTPSSGAEPKPYEWLDTGRYFVAPAKPAVLYTTEGVYGLTTIRPTSFSEPASRRVLMQAAFGAPLSSSHVFADSEMPHGASIVGADVIFVLHAPHAVCADLIWVREGQGNRRSTRVAVPMSLTADTHYWWCAVPLAEAGAAARYHYLLNGTLEVLDPAARAVKDTGSFTVVVGSDPNDATTAWSQVLDIRTVRAAARAAPWQTMGWENLLVYELHAQRFTDLSPAGLAPLALLADELQPQSRLGKSGYLHQLPVTAFELMPVHEFNSAISWGYDPSFFFAIDGHYGGGAALAQFVNAAHSAGRAVMIDVVFNHSLGSPLMQIASDVYRNGDYDGDRMNCGHPMVGEFLRQALLHLYHVFGVDGFRFDDTQTIVTRCQGGWEFLGMIRSSVRKAAEAEHQPWPYCVAENSASNPYDISDPHSGVMDGQWGIDEVFRIRDVSYDNWHAGWDDAQPLQRAMNDPAYWGRPSHQVVRFGESHDMVSEQDSSNKRIAARPVFGMGYPLAKALGALTLLSNGIPMLFMGQEIGETTPFSFDASASALNPQSRLLDPNASRVFYWFQQILGLRNDAAQGLKGDANFQSIRTANRTIAFSCGGPGALFAIVTFGTPDTRQNSAWLGLATGTTYKEIFNSCWPDFRVASELDVSNGGYTASIQSGDVLNLPATGCVILQSSSQT